MLHNRGKPRAISGSTRFLVVKQGFWASLYIFTEPDVHFYNMHRFCPRHRSPSVWHLSCCHVFKINPASFTFLYSILCCCVLHDSHHIPSLVPGAVRGYCVRIKISSPTILPESTYLYNGVLNLKVHQCLVMFYVWKDQNQTQDLPFFNFCKESASLGHKVTKHGDMS